MQQRAHDDAGSVHKQRQRRKRSTSSACFRFKLLLVSVLTSSRRIFVAHAFRCCPKRQHRSRHHTLWVVPEDKHNGTDNASLKRADELKEDSLPSPLLNNKQYPESVLDRRSLLLSSAASALLLTTSTPTPAKAEITKDAIWPLWPALPVAPYSRRRTIMKKIAEGVYTFDQLIGIYYVHVPIRMTVCVVDNGLFVYAPVAPTRECLELMKPLIEKYGPVRTIVLPSVAVEHKVNAGPFARAFPDAEFYVVDRQYAFPLNLPSRTLGLPSWTKILPESSNGSNNNNLWDGQLEHEVLTVKPGIGSEFQEAAFYHKASDTLLLCDTIVAVSDEPPFILTEEPEYVRALLFHARDDPLELVDDTPANRRKGWRRIVLLFNFFFPGAAVADLGLRPLLRLDPSYEYGWGGWLPFSWKSEEAESKAFDVYSRGGAPTIFPIIQIILARGNSGAATLEWVEKVGRWPFRRVIPQHLDAPLNMDPEAFANTFSFIEKGVNGVRFCDEDVKFLRYAEEGFLNFSVYKSELGPLQGRGGCEL
mmetsp:Transcript_3777/g.8279  ORF Transcript_3777/g.8279 Transcript_3777/m.8279 type:complete len:534 (-) Transcript_3777:11-1612(-)